MKTIKVIETKIIEHTIVIRKEWPKDKTPELHLSEAIENIGFQNIATQESKIIEHEIHSESGNLLS